MRGMSRYDVVIVGAGAAGLTAAIFAGRAARERRVPARIAVVDGAKRIGAKILISGGGRCNVTHDVVTPADFNGANRNLVAKVLRSFDVDATVAFFEELGVTLKREETGKLFPVSNQARSIVDALVNAVHDAGVEIVLGTRVTSVNRATDGFVLETESGTLDAASVVLATGGRSVPKTGSDGAGYSIATALGHTLGETFPALVPLLLPHGHWLTALSGLTIDAELELRAAHGRVLRRERGSLLFTHFGLSGPLVLDVSRHWLAARRDGDVRLALNLLPDDLFESIERSLIEESTRNPHATIASTLRKRLPERLVSAVALEVAALGADVTLGRVSKAERRRLVHALVSTELPVTRDRGFDYAEVTAGGIPLVEVDVTTMQSRRCEGLFLCGELLDVDGRIGGYNFQWAWASGRLAGRSASRSANAQSGMAMSNADSGGSPS
jgi:predicted Rossmann fold flavoprotein